MEEIEIKPQKPLAQRIKEMPASYYLVSVMVAVFALVHIMNFLGYQDYIFNNFAKSTINISLDKEYYRLFTAIFLHLNIAHLFFNAMATIYLSKPIEVYFGKVKFLIIFLVAGLFGSLASFMFVANPSIGASGGVFGIFGVHIYLYFKNKAGYKRVFGKDVFTLLGLNLLMGFVIPNIDMWGHVGGVVGGFLAALTLGFSHKFKFNKNLIIGGLLTGALFMASFTYTNTSYKDYANKTSDLYLQFNQAIESDDILLFYQVRQATEELIDNPPLLPPTPVIDYNLERLMQIFLEHDKNQNTTNKN